MKTRFNILALSRDRRGTMAIETAIVAPVLVLLSLGGFDVSRMVARQHELQSGMAEAEAVALAANMGGEMETPDLQKMLKKRLDLEEQQVTVTKIYRCNASTTVSTTEPECDGPNDVMSTYVRVDLTDSYTPLWSKLGVSSRFNYNLTRTVQLS